MTQEQALERYEDKLYILKTGQENLRHYLQDYKKNAIQCGLIWRGLKLAYKRVKEYAAILEQSKAVN